MRITPMPDRTGARSPRFFPVEFLYQSAIVLGPLFRRLPPCASKFSFYREIRTWIPYSSPLSLFQMTWPTFPSMATSSINEACPLCW